MPGKDVKAAVCIGDNDGAHHCNDAESLGYLQLRLRPHRLLVVGADLVARRRQREEGNVGNDLGCPRSWMGSVVHGMQVRIGFFQFLALVDTLIELVAETFASYWNAFSAASHWISLCSVCDVTLQTKAMGRSTSSFFFLLLIISIVVVAASEMANGKHGRSLVANKHKHRHSGFSAAECPGACQFRCSKTAYRKPCLYFCQECCYKCRCVPPGTYAHKEVCPCYNSWKTKRGGPKCP
ncbi:hypothetical protein HPP92_004897 [Vanilla planifolia]|uniref:Uncharacterized protein n=1 Tax=Vanilla planifolia TaxID=51239 RepID=A0A835V8J8_VANPL|nr:hypothetical protein HPP92_004897 [Vanilla planifolia]